MPAFFWISWNSIPSDLVALNDCPTIPSAAPQQQTSNKKKRSSNWVFHETRSFSTKKNSQKVILSWRVPWRVFSQTKNPFSYIPMPKKTRIFHRSLVVSPIGRACVSALDLATPRRTSCSSTRAAQSWCHLMNFKKSWEVWWFKWFSGFQKIGGDFAVPSREVSRGVLQTPFFGKVKVCEDFFLKNVPDHLLESLQALLVAPGWYTHNSPPIQVF